MTQTIFARIRLLLDQTEQQIVGMYRDPQRVGAVIRSVDQIDELLAELRGPQYDARAEENRAAALRERLENEADQVARAVRAGGLAAQLGDSPAWQRVSVAAADRQRRRRRRLAVGGGAAAIVAVLLFVVLPLVFPPVPTADLTQASELAVAGSVDEALAAARAERERVPSDPVAALWVGALEQQRGNQAAAEEAWAEARRLYGDDAQFLALRSAVLLQLGDQAGAERDARALLEQPQSQAIGFYQLGAVREAAGQRDQAIEAYTQAAEAAEAADQPQLVVAARARIGSLLQRPADR